MVATVQSSGWFQVSSVRKLEMVSSGFPNLLQDSNWANLKLSPGICPLLIFLVPDTSIQMKNCCKGKFDQDDARGTFALLRCNKPCKTISETDNEHLKHSG